MKFFQNHIANKYVEKHGYQDTSYTVDQCVPRKTKTFHKLWPLSVGMIILATIGALSLVQMGAVAARVYHWYHDADAEAPGARVPEPDTVISCYYNTPRAGAGAPDTQLQPAAIPPRLCTHLNVAFAQIVNKSIHLEQSQTESLREVVKLKQKNPALKILLSIGGAGENNGFSDMVKDHASRKVFIKSIKSTLRNYSLDGVDLDWEFPVIHDQLTEGASRERQHFSQLLREIRTEYIREKRNYILTVALAAQQTIADVAYDVDQINLYVDFANIMTYDFHFYSKFTPFTGFNSPLYARPSEGLFLATLNTNYTVHMYKDKGLDRDRIVIGIPTYGHTFKLVNPNNTNVGSPARGVGAVGGGGFAGYRAVCRFAGAHRDAALRWEPRARVPFLSRGDEWISYESPRSVLHKAAYARRHRLRGAMLYSLNADDFEGSCARAPDADGPFPLARAVVAALRPPRPPRRGSRPPPSGNITKR